MKSSSRFPLPHGTFYRLVIRLILGTILGAGCLPTAIQPPFTATAHLPSTATAVTADNPYEIISEESLLAYLADLTSIQPYSGWRNSASSGEVEALDYVEGKLNEFSNLKGIELERQSFGVYLGTEIWESRLTLTIGGKEIIVPADALRGPSKRKFNATYFDSDGSPSDLAHDPLMADGSPIVLQNAGDLYTLGAGDVKDRVLFLDYSLIDTVTNEDATLNTAQLISLVDQGLAGVVLVTQYSNRPGQSRGSFIGEAYNFVFAVPSRRVPFMYVRIEDLTPAGISTWGDLPRIEAAHLVVDTDVLSPGKAGNLIARIPGADSSKAVILGAHIDSPNGPGGFDDGSGSAALLEVARVLNASQVQPPSDVYLAWFGGHEIGTYGSAHFAATHQELLDRTAAVMIMDGLGHPMDGRKSNITMQYTPYGKFGVDSMPLYDFLSESVASQGLTVDHLAEYGLIADNSNFDAFDVPNIYLGYENQRDLQQPSGYYHYANHWHDPYETTDKVREVGGVFVDMTKVMLSAALETDNTGTTRVTPPSTRRALFVASHTEMENVPTSMLRELGMALAWEGFDVDMIPYGQALTSSDLKDVELVVLPPTLDYPGNKGKWSAAEFNLLDAYVAEGGFLVVTNSRCAYASKFCLDDTNEDTRVLNPLLEPMGLKYRVVGFGSSVNSIALSTTDHPLTHNAEYITFYEGNGIPFDLATGTVLFQAGGNPMVGLVDYGDKGGQVLVVADLGILQTDMQGSKNMEFIKNVASFARTRSGD